MDDVNTQITEQQRVTLKVNGKILVTSLLPSGGGAKVEHQAVEGGAYLSFEILVEPEPEDDGGR